MQNSSTVAEFLSSWRAMLPSSDRARLSEAVPKLNQYLCVSA